MKLFEELANEINELLALSNPSRDKLETAKLEIDEFIGSSDFEQLDELDAEWANELAEDIYKKLQMLIQHDAKVPFGTQIDKVKPVSEKTILQQDKSGSPEADRLLDQAEEKFYAGEYKDAINLYERVLAIDNGKERALAHKKEAEDFLRTGKIPDVALPPDVARAYGKAQSAERRGDYELAMRLIEQARDILRRSGTTRWEAGTKFEDSVQTLADAKSLSDESNELFREGKMDMAIARVQKAANISGLPEYGDKVDAYKKFRNELGMIRERLTAPEITPTLLMETKSLLDRLSHEYSFDHPSLMPLFDTFDIKKPGIVSLLRNEIKQLLKQSKYAQTLDEARNAVRSAKKKLDEVKILGGVDEDYSELQESCTKENAIIEELSDELDRAKRALATKSKIFPRDTYQASTRVRERFQNDPAIIDLEKGLRGYKLIIGVIWSFAVIALILLVISLWNNIVRDWVFPPPPTGTPTLTATETITPLPTSTSTITPTATATLTPSLTPLPPMCTIQERAWIKNGCYSAFNAIGDRVPEGATVIIDPDHGVKTDTTGLQCIYVTYKDGEKEVSGWLLMSSCSNE
jgi:tetratricopeptide (TPR) repeat protein